MTDNGEDGTDSVHVDVVGIQCTSYPDTCTFAMQAGVFDDATGAEQFLPSMRHFETCPTCGADVERWEPEYERSIPGRPLNLTR